MNDLYRDLLRKLVQQIEMGNLTDEHGHNFKMNRAFLDAKAALQRNTNRDEEFPKQ